MTAHAQIHGVLPGGPAPRLSVQTRSLRILFLVSAHNGLSQRAVDRVDRARPRGDGRGGRLGSARWRRPSTSTIRSSIVCPFLKTVIPESIWAEHRCLIVHPGPKGDRGPSSLDWAIELGAPSGG